MRWPWGRIPAAPVCDLVQYWDRKDPPAAVAKLMKTWSRDRTFVCHRYDRDAAEAFIAAHFDADVLAAFRTCAAPAMQSDLFRYCRLYVTGGLYLDADTRNLGGLDRLIASTGRGLLMSRRQRVATDVLFVRAPGDPLLERVIKQSVVNIEARISDNVWHVAGPGVVNRLYRKADAGLFEGFTFLPRETISQSVGFVRMAYGADVHDWRNPDGPVFGPS